MLEKLLADNERAMLELRKSIETSSGAALRADLDALAGGLDRHITANRREMGKLWYQLRRETPAAGRADDDALPGDTDVQSLLDLQRSFGAGGGGN